MVSCTINGDFKKTDNFLKKLLNITFRDKLEKYGQKGVDALKEATPKRTGLTANSWSYEIIEDANSIRIVWSNSNTNKNIPIAIVLQYGHVTRNGHFVEGIDYINPALRPIFESIAETAWKEVTR